MSKTLPEKLLAYFPYFCGAVFFFVYELSNANGFFWGDGGEFVATANILGIGHAYGHPLFWLLGRISILFQPDNPAAAMNHLVVLLSSATCTVVALWVKNWVDEKIPPVHRMFVIFSVTGIFATGNIIWSQSSYVEVYNLQALFLALSLYFLDRFFNRENRPNHLFLAAFFIGIAATLGMYALSVGILPVLLWIFLKRKPKICFSYLLICSVCFLLGLSLWLYLPIRSGLNPPLLIENINSVENLFSYLRRTNYLTTDVAGLAILPLSLFKSFTILFSNISLWGILLLICGAIFDRKSSHGLLPYFISAIVLTLLFAFLLPLNLNISQLVEMEVYFIPVLLLAIPLITVGATRLTHRLKNSLRFLILLPVAGTILLRWADINLADKHTADKFLEYLKKNLPESSVIMPMSDEVSYPIYYLIFALNNPKNLSLYDNDPLDFTKTNLIEQPGGKSFLVYAHGRVVQEIKSFENIKLAGPFLLNQKDSAKVIKLEEEFIQQFCYENLEKTSLNEKDRIFLARIWNGRALYCFGVLSNLSADSPQKHEAYKNALMTFYQAYRFDDFSFNGALYASNISIMLNNAGKSEEALQFAKQALDLNPYCAEAFKALYHVSMNKKDYQQALENLHKYAKYSPQDGEIQINLAVLYMILDLPDQAKRSYQKGLKLGGTPRPELGLIIKK